MRKPREYKPNADFDKRGTPDAPSKSGPDRDAIASVLKWFARGEISQGAAVDAIIDLSTLTSAHTEGTAMSDRFYIVNQHIGWLKQYIVGMSDDNWRDMRLRAERQLEGLSEEIDKIDAALLSPQENAE